VNDQFRGGTAEAYRPRFRALLDRAIAFADRDPRRVFVLSIPDWSVTPFAEGRDRPVIAAAIRAFNDANRDEADRAGTFERSSAPAQNRSSVHWLNITDSSRRAAHDPTLLAADGLHPSAAMYREWAQLVLPEALAILGPQNR
jgi:lysophospholipase L1-like esterase